MSSLGISVGKCLRINLTYCIGLNFFVLRVNADIPSLVFPCLDGQQEEVQLDVADFGDFGERHPDEGGRQRLRDDELVARVEVVLLPFGDV